MTFFRIFSAVVPDTGCDWYDETENHRIMMDGVAHLVNIGSCFSVRVYSSRHDFMCGANPYAMLNYAGNGVIEVIDVFSDGVRRMHITPASPLLVAGRVGSRVRTLEKKHLQAWRMRVMRAQHAISVHHA